ncbi:hypothetical protein [Sinomonas flava]
MGGRPGHCRVPGAQGWPEGRIDLDPTAERRIGRFAYLSYTVRQASRE